MKILSVFAILAVSLNAEAISWKIFGACKSTAVFEGSHPADLNKSVGEIGIEIFDGNKIPYVGAAEGINSLLNSPTGMDSIEVVSETEMRVYGWCYTVNGQQPKEMPHLMRFKSQDDKLVWFYAYSTNKGNKWTDYCSPAYGIKAPQFCGR